MRRAGGVPLVLMAFALSASPGPPSEPTGEVFRYPTTGATFPVLLDPATGRKFLAGPAGARFDSVEDVVRAEEAGLPLLRRVVAPSLWPAAEVPALAAEPVKVILVLRSQPVHDVSRTVRDRVREELAPKFARLRSLLQGIASRRTGGNDGTRQVGDLIEEEKRLLSAGEQEEIAGIRQDVKDTVHAMRREILAAARPRATLEQDEVAAFVAALPGAKVRGRSLVLSAVAATVPAARIRDIVEGLPAVACVYEDADSPPALDRAVRSIGGRTWWDAGYDGGSGVGVGDFDTGVDASHPAFNGTVVSKNFAGLDAQGNDSADDISGHGTHIAGILGSRDSLYRGVAPGCTVFNGRSGYYYLSGSAMMAAGDWAADNGCDIFSNSIGGYGNSTGNHSFALYNDAASAEIAVSVAAAAANYGFMTDGLAPNSTGFNGFCVSNYAPGLNSRSENVFNDSSSHGPCSDGRHKPDIAAPGTAPWSAAHDWEGANNDFIQMAGTSMSAPMVAGSLALLYDYGASWTPEGMKALLLATTWNDSPTPAGWDYGWGFGALDLVAAFAARASVREGTFTSSGQTSAWLTGPALAAGQKVALCWNRQVAWNDGSAPTSYKSIVDLDLEVYATDGTLLGKSGTVLDSVERVTVPTDVPGTLIRVIRSGAFPAGQTDVDWAVAAGGGSTSIPILAAPSGTLVIAGGSAAVQGPSTTVQMIAVAGNEVVTRMRVRNGGGSFGEWADLQTSFPWFLEPGAGIRSVEAQVRDAAGVESTVFSDTVLADPDVPTGSFVLSGGREYLMPWEDLTADWTADDGGGSGVEALRIRWGGTTPWSAWMPLATGPELPLARPETEAAGAEGQFRDVAGNLSAITPASIRLVPPDATPLGRARTVRGLLLPGGSGGSFRLGALPGDTFSVFLKVRRSRKHPVLPLLADLWAPSHAAVALGRFPEDGRRPGIAGFQATQAGDHWIVVRPQGDVPDEGLAFTLKVKVRRSKGVPLVSGVAAPVTGVATIPFDALDGTLVDGSLAPIPEAALTQPVLLTPDGPVAPLPGTRGADGVLRFEGLALGGGTGTYRIEVATQEPIAWVLRFRHPRR